eukprot:2617019-Amphidinium_carterae.2
MAEHQQNDATWLQSWLTFIATNLGLASSPPSHIEKKEARNFCSAKHAASGNGACPSIITLATTAVYGIGVV